MGVTVAVVLVATVIVVIIVVVVVDEVLVLVLGVLVLVVEVLVLVVEVLVLVVEVLVLVALLDVLDVVGGFGWLLMQLQASRTALSANCSSLDGFLHCFFWNFSQKWASKVLT